MAGPAVGVRAVADGIQPLPPLAAGRSMGPDADRTPGPGGRGRADHLGSQRRFHDLPGPPTLGRCPARRAESEGATGRDPHRAHPTHALGRSRGGLTTKIHLACEQDRSPCHCRSRQVSAVTARSSRPSWTPSVFPGSVPGGPVSGRYGCGATRPIRPPPTGPLCGVGHPLQDSGASRPRLQPQTPRQSRRTAAGLRPGGLQGPACGRVRYQSTQTQPGGRHPVRQTRRPLRSHHPRHGDQRVALTSPVSQVPMPCRLQPGPARTNGRLVDDG